MFWFMCQSAGRNEYEGKGKKARKKQQQLLKQEQLEKRREQQQKKAKPKISDVLIQGPETVEAPKDGEESDDEKEALFAEENISQESGSIIDSLTGCPHPEDILLFAIPVCSPYNTMHNYKYKVKLTPGNSKRGKAAKTALHMFQLSKDTTSREKDLFKSVRDNDLSRNLPGKVKVSAPNLQKMKRK
ncbi:ribosome quality control complex subunit NEMF-like [Saccoglossus kowalevskii]